MKNVNIEKRKKHMGLYIILGVVAVIAIYLIIQGFGCSNAKKKGIERINSYNAKTVELSYGKMTYVDKGEGDVILSVHGLFGGYDQAYDTVADFANDYRILATSRFGYLGSEVLGEGTPAEQAKAFKELLDKLGIDKAYVLATSAGGSVAIRFALDYPERTKGLILYCSAMPLNEKPAKINEYVGPPAFLCNDYAMYLMSPFFEPIMGMAPETIFSMMPIDQRKAGAVIDASKTNPDMERNFDDYKIEELQMPTLILHAKDDKLANYDNVAKVNHRFPNCRLVIFETGGHLMAGNGEKIKEEVGTFVEKNK